MKFPDLVTTKTKANKETANLWNVLQTTDMDCIYIKRKDIPHDEQTQHCDIHDITFLALNRSKYHFNFIIHNQLSMTIKVYLY